MPHTIDPTSIDLRSLMRVHPLWLSRKDDWTTIEALRTKRMDFRHYIPKGPIEDPTDYATRIKMTRFVPESTAARNRAVGAVFDTSPNRDEVPQQLRDWSKSVDRSRRTLEHWLEIKAVPITFDFGACHVLVDRPKLPEGAPRPESQADEEDLGIRDPFLAAYTPLAVRNWAVDDRGALQWVLIVEDGSEADTSLGARSPVRTYRLFDQTHWHIWKTKPADSGKNTLHATSWDDNGEPDERSMKSEMLITGSQFSDQHGSPGTVPLACLMADPDVEIVGRSLIEAAVELDLKRLGLESDQFWDLWNHAHPLLYLRAKAPPSELQLGTTKFVHLDPEFNEEVGYASPPAEAFQARERAIAQVLSDTYRHTGVDPLGVLTQGAEPTEASGVARAWSYKTSEGRHISRLRDRVEEGENRIYQIVALFLATAMTEPNPAKWPNEFDTETTAETLENAASAKSLLRLSPTATRILTKRVASRALGELTLEQRVTIEGEIDSASDEELVPSFSHQPVGMFGSEEETQ